MKTKIKKISISTLFISLSLVSGCASRPKLYPNQTLKSRGTEVAKADIDLCLKEAETYLDSSEGKKIAKGAGFGAVVGGAVGAVAGAFSGNIARGAAEGAAIGGVGGGVSGSMTPDQLKHRYVNKCLSEKGYEVLGWD